MANQENQRQRGCNLAQRAFNYVVATAMIVGPLCFATKRFERNAKVLREAQKRAVARGQVPPARRQG